MELLNPFDAALLATLLVAFVGVVAWRLDDPEHFG